MNVPDDEAKSLGALVEALLAFVGVLLTHRLRGFPPVSIRFPIIGRGLTIIVQALALVSQGTPLISQAVTFVGPLNTLMGRLPAAPPQPRKSA